MRRASGTGAGRGVAMATALAVLALPLMIAACTENPPTAPASAFSGTWDLSAVNGIPLPQTIAVTIDGSRRLLVDAQLVSRTRGRIDDIKRFVWQRPDGSRFDEVVDTVTSPFTATEATLLIRRYALLAASDWVDTGVVSAGSVALRARYLVQQFGPVANVRLTYLRRP